MYFPLLFLPPGAASLVAHHFRSSITKREDHSLPRRPAFCFDLRNFPLHFFCFASINLAGRPITFGAQSPRGKTTHFSPPFWAHNSFGLRNFPPLFNQLCNPILLAFLLIMWTNFHGQSYLLGPLWVPSSCLTALTARRPIFFQSLARSPSGFALDFASSSKCFPFCNRNGGPKSKFTTPHQSNTQPNKISNQISNQMAIEIHQTHSPLHWPRASQLRNQQTTTNKREVNSQLIRGKWIHLSSLLCAPI